MGVNITWSKELQGCSYHYIIQKDCVAYTTFNGLTEFRAWLMLHELKLRSTHSREGVKCWVVTNKDIKEAAGFWDLDAVPKEAIRYINFSNGSLVDCYVLIGVKENIVYRPNPNAKNVYKPYDHAMAMGLLQRGHCLHSQTWEDIRC